jgi:hypothetical protein
MVLGPRKSGKGVVKAAPKGAPKKRVATVKAAKPAADAEAPAEVEKK